MVKVEHGLVLSRSAFISSRDASADVWVRTTLTEVARTAGQKRPFGACQIGLLPGLGGDTGHSTERQDYQATEN